MIKYYSITFLFLFLVSITHSQNLRFETGRNFKIVQFTDVHFKPNDAESDTAIELIKKVLAAEKPDLVVFTGDIAWGPTTKECFDRVLKPVIKRKIQWAYVNGNHDDEHDWSRTQLMDYLVTKPYCLAQHGDKHLQGEGNYILEIRASDDKDKIANLLYFFDSGGYNELHPSVGWSYEWLSNEQVNWYRTQSKAYTAQNDGKPYNAFAFFHIPLAEYPIMSVKKDEIIGHYNEQECNGKINTGMFAAMIESGDVMGTFVGNDHDNDYIGNYMGIALAYGRYSGGNTVYNNLGLNGCRVINIEEDKRQFSTYIRLRNDEILFPVNFPNDFKKEK